MKKPHLSPLVTVTLLFAVFIIGYFLGRNYNTADVQVSAFLSGSSQYQAAEPSVSVATEAVSPVPSAAVNINSADLSQLMTLPGIGQTIAQKIIDYRNANGPFRSISELIYVDGIGEKKLADLIEYITVQEE